MIRPAGFRGAAFGNAADGDPRRDDGARRVWSESLEVSPMWAWANQVHGARVATATAPGLLGEADALVATASDLPVAVATADCVPIVIEGDHAVAVVHAGWRGIVAGVVESAIEGLNASGSPPRRAAVGPAIQACCYEVGEDVAREFPEHRATTSWGTASVDLTAAVADRLAPLDIWRSTACTMSSEGFHSYRRDGSNERQVAVGWLPALAS